jgi:beta-galactosidase
MKNQLCLLLLLTAFLKSMAQQVYELDATMNQDPFRETLNLGGNNPKGLAIAFNNHYMSIGGQPVIPVTGEFHFTRYPRQYWDESIKKMKAGGINVIATYVFWNLHEEKEGTFLWYGDNDLRAFIKLCKDNDIYVIVRVGPFCHGEIRNGGLPDWLLGRALNIRSNDPLYLYYVERLYGETAKQLKGLYYKDGGPIIGIQIENEYQHSAAPWGLTYPGQPGDLTAADRDLALTQEGVGVSEAENPYAALGNDHMKVLKTLAVNAGMQVPLYTATGWGNAAIIPNESIPVTAAYAYPFWTPRRDHSPFFLYKDMHKSPDYAPVRYNPEDYPVFAAELGSGIMSVYTRRPIAVHKSFDAMINRCLGSGANGIGYYMYHGGSTPKGQSSFMSDEAYGLPKISYDFQAPIGEYGQVREGFHRLKLLHFFVHDFGAQLAPMQTVLPANAAQLKPQNITDLRYAARVKGSSGFLFINNFQDDTTMVAQKNIRISIKTKSGEIMVPEKGGITLDSDENAVFPFNMDVSGAHLNYATAQLMAKGEQGGEPYYIFFTPNGITAEFSFAPGAAVEGSGIAVDKNTNRLIVTCNTPIAEFKLTANRKTTKILVVDKATALKSYRVTIAGKQYFMFSNALVLQYKRGFECISNAPEFEVSLYPEYTGLARVGNGKIERQQGNGVFSVYKIILQKIDVAISSRQVSTNKWVVSLPSSLLENTNDVLLTVNYTGDTAMAFLDGQLVADEFYKGIPWQIGLRKFLSGKPREMVLYFRAMQKKASYLIDLQPYPESIPDFGTASKYLKVGAITAAAQYKTILTF